MKLYSKTGKQGENWYVEGSDTEKFRYNAYRKNNREIAEDAYKINADLWMPLHFIIEPTNRCNMKCSFCSREEMTRPIADLPMNWFKKAIDQFVEGRGHSISLYALGEPMLHDYIDEMVVYAKQCGVPYVDISTNGTCDLTDLVGTGLNELIVSIDHLGDMKHVQYLHHLKEKLGSPTPIIRGQVIKFKENAKLIENAIKELKEGSIFDVIYVKNIESFSHVLGDKNLSKKEIKSRLKNAAPCRQLFFAITLQADGFWSACCHQVNNNAVLGHVEEISLKEAWEKVKEIRHEHIKGNFNVLGGDCEKCVDRRW